MLKLQIEMTHAVQKEEQPESGPGNDGEQKQEGETERGTKMTPAQFWTILALGKCVRKPTSPTSNRGGLWGALAGPGAVTQQHPH